MGLIKAGLGAVNGVLADQWKEYFYCEAIPNDVLAIKGQKKTSKRSSNTKGDENIISSGSIVAVADGQCMLIVEQGKVVEACAEPGEFIFDASTEPSIFAGNLGSSILETFKNVGKRFTFGGEAPKDQRVYYFNTKEIVGNKYGTPNPVPFRVVDQRAGIDIDISIKCFGEYSYKMVNPLLFYVNVCGNVTSKYTRDQLDSQMKSELLTALQPAFAKISDQGIRYSQLPGHTTEMADALNDVMSEKWRDLRGIEIASFGISSVTADEEDEAMIKEMQKQAAYVDPNLANASRVSAVNDALRGAASNPGGATVGIMGMNMVQGVAGNDLGMVQQQAAQNAAAQQQAAAADSWVCPKCGAVNTGNFCPKCGEKKPAPAEEWVCPKCGVKNTGNFCTACGEKKPEAPASWICPKCGVENTGNFCQACGEKKPE